MVKNIPPTTNCHTNHFHPVSDKAHFRIGDFLAKLYKYFFIYLLCTQDTKQKSNQQPANDKIT